MGAAVTPAVVPLHSTSQQGPQFIGFGLALAAALAAAWLVAILVEKVVTRKQAQATALVWSSLERRCKRPFRATIAVAALLAALPYAGLNVLAAADVGRALVLALIAALAWLLIEATGVAQDVALSHLKMDSHDSRRVRRLRTQILVFRRLIGVALVTVAVAAAVMTIPAARAIGASFLVSAGVLSVVAGLAAQSTLSNLIAGLQIALTDPIRIDDVVVVNNEWGRIDEITLTYVVVRTWDNRRLILPISWFTDNVFQNWTRHETRVLGSIYWHVDFTVPVEELRDEMHRLVQSSPLWDGKDWVLQVVDTTPSTMVLRGLVSSADAPSNWDLCCEVRERLLVFLREHHPDALPKVRADVANPTADHARYAADTNGRGRSAPSTRTQSTTE